MKTSQARSSGFTLVELVVVLIIVGALAATALPRLISLTAFDQRGFLDETVAALRYGQKAAIASRRNVCAAFTANSLTLSIASAAGSAAACDIPLRSPMGDASFQIPPPGRRPSSAVFQSIYPAFHFDALGRPRSSPDGFLATQTLQIVGVVQTIKVEAETGTVHAD